MTGLELNKLLNEALAKYGLTVKFVTESSYMPTTGVIMMPKGKRRAGRVNTTSEAGKPPNQGDPSRATQDLLNGHWQRDISNDEDLPRGPRREDGVDMGSKESIEEGECHVLS